MVISLDAKPDKEEQAEDKRDEAAELKVVHGGGTNTPNRWLDKILNVCMHHICSIAHFVHNQNT
jgi:hypothetical protein